MKSKQVLDPIDEMDEDNYHNSDINIPRPNQFPPSSQYNQIDS